MNILRFDRQGSRLASGGKDTDVILWNLLNESAEFKLRGHKDQITGVEFLKTCTGPGLNQSSDEIINVTDAFEERYLLTTSKDALIKIWDTDSPYCVETHATQANGECWALALSPEGDGCITAGNDGELRVWSMDLAALAKIDKVQLEGQGISVLSSRGVFNRQSKEKSTGVSFHPKADFVAVHGPEKAIEVWRIRNADEVSKHLQRKRKRRREKAASAGESLLPEADGAPGVPDVMDIFVPYVVVRTGGRIRSVDWIRTSTKASKGRLQLLAATTNNQLESYAIAQQKANANSRETPEYHRLLTVDLPGHRTDVRTLALSSDDRMLASASNGHLKIWNMRTRSCLRTLECGQALCSAFLPGDRIVLVGTKTGDLELYDITTSTLIESMKGHEGAIWTLAVHPDGKSVVTGSEDKSAKFWRFDIVEEEIPGTRRTTQRLKLTQTRQLKVADHILSLCFSPDQRLLAVSTLDNTVKVFFVDSLKLFLTLYGHKLPALSLSISPDSKVIATCSADKNIRLWGLDFGDCHKAFFAHNDSVMGVSFIPHPIERDERHLFFSCSKDGTVKSWDGDKFEQIQRLSGHKGEVWAMAVGRTGETVVTASHDKSIRIWEIGDDLVFLEEERERELEQMYEATLATTIDRDRQNDEAAGGADVTAASKQTISTLTHGEKILEALELGIADHELMTAHDRDKLTHPHLAAPQRHPIFRAHGNISAAQHVLRTLETIPPAALHDALLVLPFSALPALFTFLVLFLRRRDRPELAWRIAYFLLSAHTQQIVASRQLRGVLDEVRVCWTAWLEEERHVVGVNLAGLRVLSREVRELEVGTFVGDEDGEDVLERGRKKRTFASVA